MLNHDISSLSENELNNFLKKNKKKLDEKFLTDNITAFNSAHWDTISQHIRLSENFMHKFRNKINWKKAFKYQNFSIAFIEDKKYAGRPVWKSILTNKIVDEELIEKYWMAGKMPWKTKHDQDWPIFSSRQFSQAFINRHPEKLSTFMHTQALPE